MYRMLTRIKKQRLVRAILIVTAVLCCAYFFSLTGTYVLAYRTEKTAHIFPTQTSGAGWSGLDRALVQELPPQAPLGAFNEANSAFLISEVVQVIPEGAVEVAAPLLETDSATSSPETSGENTPDTNVDSSVDTTTPEEVPVIDVEESEAQTEMTEESSPAAPVEETVTPAPSDSPEVSPDAVPAPTESSLRYFATPVYAKVDKVKTATDEQNSATSTEAGTDDSQDEDVETAKSDESTTVAEGISDVAACSITGRECHTIQLSGFGVEGGLTTRPLKSVALNFSFAYDVNDVVPNEDKLVVRYFHEGRWRLAGEIFLSNDISNATNGGYFSQELKDITEWSQLDEVIVEVEYERSGVSPVRAYLDGVWLDAVYRERPQDIFSSEEGLPDDVADNVTDELRRDAGLIKLLLDDASHIVFPFVDDMGEDTLVMRTHKRSYDARAARDSGEVSRNTVYASVTNESEEPEQFALHVAFPEARGSVLELAQFMRNVPASSVRELRDNVTYFCESGWQVVPESEFYSCETTNELQACTLLNEERTNCEVSNVVVGTEESTVYGSDWVTQTIAQARQLPEGMLPDDMQTVAASERSYEILPGQTIFFRLELESPDAGAQQFFLFAEGLIGRGDVDARFLRDEVTWRAEEAQLKKADKKRVNQRISTRTEFDGDELPEFSFKFKSQRSPFERVLNELMGRDNSFAVAATLQRPRGAKENVEVNIETEENGEWKLEFKKHPRSFRPGKYSLELTITEGGSTYTDTVEFYWGVLAVNSHKSVYEPGEKVQFSMAVLDDVGNTICDANTDFVITTPEGIVQTVPVSTSGLCGPNNVVDVPDYSAVYTAGGTGTYTVTFTHLDDVGNVFHRITDTFEVWQDAGFSVSRKGPTRIYPKAPYDMELTITARRPFSGTVREPVPKGFVITEKGGAELRQYGETLELVWGLSLAAGETKTLSYTFDAPDVSPYLFILGPLSLSEQEVIFEEQRTWKIASDALGSYVEKHEAWSPASAGTWITKDLSGAPFSVPANAVVEIALVNSDPGNEWQAGVRNGTSTLSRIFDIHEPEPQGVTMMTMHVQASATSSIATFAEDSTYISYILLGYWSDGRYIERFDQIDPGIANGTWGNINLTTYGVADTNVAEMVIGNWDGNNQMLGGVRHRDSSLNRYADIHEPEQGGMTGVTMMVKASTSNATIQGYAQTEGANNASIDYWLVGYWQRNPNGLDYTERFDTLNGTTSSSVWADEALDSYGVPPTGIAQVLYANTADANSSQIIGVRTDGSSVTRSQNLHEAEGGGWNATQAHVKAGSGASSTIELFTDDTTNDLYRLLGYWSANNYPANAPTLYNEPFDSEKTGTSTPTFVFSTTDPDGTSDLVYQFQWDDDPVLDDSPVGDRSSDDESGCSPNCFQNATTPADTSPFTEGNLIRFKIQTPLVSGTTYYWRVRATDVTGSNSASEWSDVHSFTYVANTDPQAWFQTQDTQFDTGTFSSAETSGSNSVELVTTAPTGAMIAYGEGVVQTPRYRLWSGTSWGSELSASSVGGTIQWMQVKAGTTRNEYVLGTQDDQGDVNVQIYDGGGATWGDLQEVHVNISDATRRGFDVTYETVSGDAMVVSCVGTEANYRTWDGNSWSASSTINLSSANNCEWIRLASDPASDEIVMVARDTGSVYEAQVWDGSAWSNPVTMGSMEQPAHEGIAVEYEESGNQALVVTSNGTNANFAWAAWDGTNWSVPTTQTLGNDLEWGILKRDSGSDNMALCYNDQSDDSGLVRWDGSSWQTFQEYETVSKTGASGVPDGRSVSCEFETTSGRDGYIMIPYSDSNNARYTFWNNSILSTEASISTILDSWTIGSVRTGDGSILGFFHDDGNSRYDFSYWNGSSWSVLQTLENSASVTADPYREPITMAAQVYQASSGTVTSETIDFDVVQGQPTWGEVTWNTTEPNGTNVLLQVMYESGGVCSTLIPDGSLSGNSSGIDASLSPLDLSGLSTTTYNRICLKATLSSTNANIPSLDDWTVSWERQPFLTQAHYRWYVNTTSLTPTDAWPSGGTDLGEDAAIPTSYAPIPSDVLRLRMSVLNENVSLSSASLTLRLQYAEGSSCSASMTWLDVGAVGSTTAKWRGYDNTGLTDATTLPSVLLTGSDVRATYEEGNDAAANPLSATANQELEWDWVIQHNASSSVNYCFRTITAEGEALNDYDVFPSLITNSRPGAPTLEKLFDNEQVASTTPWFEFAAEDPEANDMTYQIQVDNDSDFSSAVLDRNSQTNFTEFSNIITTSDKDPFTSGQTVRFVPTTALSDGTTYYWRVRAKDRNASNEWSDWSSTYSFTVNTATTITTWHQTTLAQFSTNSHEDTEATSTNEVVLTPPQTVGTSTSAYADFDWRTEGNAWGQLSWNDTETSSDILYRLEYLNGSTWTLIPDSDLPGNTAGFDTSPISLLSLSPTTYNQIRIRANLTNVGATPRLSDWTIEWGLAVEQPTQIALFDNEKTGTTTPTFRFSSSDPQSDDLVYQLSISTDNTFVTSSTTRSSDLHAGFANTASSTDTSPFVEGDTISFKVQQADALSNGQTYWWRVRARDPNGGDTWSTWSDIRSFTVDTTVTVSTWFQTTDEQFETDTLTDTEVYGSDTVRITSTIREAFVAYAEGTALVPKYRLWNGTSWGDEQSGESVADTIRFVEASAAPTRDEYIIATMGSSGGVRGQVYDGDTDVTGNVTSNLTVVSDATQRGFDVVHETDSGDALLVACSGTEATYSVWNGLTWTGTTTIPLSVSANCEWVKLAADPTSDEIILVVRDATTGAIDYEALVWNGSAWGNSTTTGSQVTPNDEGIAVEYEESGGQAIVAVSNGANNNFISMAWNGSAWSFVGAPALGNDFGSGRLTRDVGTDRLGFCYIDINSDIGFLEWSGSGWNTNSIFEVTGNTTNGFNARPVTCEFETQGSRDGYLMIPYSDSIQAEYVYWTGSGSPTVPAVLTTISDSWEMRSTRTGDGNILVVAYDDAGTEYDFTYWNGTAWSDEEVLETTSINTVTPATVPLDIVARQYPSFTSGTVVSSEIDFDEGTGPKWDYVTWTDSTPGASNILYQVEYFTSTSSWAVIPNVALAGNMAGTTTAPIDLSNVNRTTYNTLRLKANFACSGGDCPTLSDWTLAWSEGVTVSGTIQEYDQSTNVTSGTVHVAVNGTLQSGKTAAISNGTWSIANVTAFAGDVITVFIDGANDEDEAAGVTVYDGDGDITGFTLYERHLSIGSNDNATITNANLSQYDYSGSLNDEDVFFDVDAGNDLAVCALPATCDNAELWIKAQNTYRPDSTSGGNVATHDIEINGTLTADGNTLTVSGSWDNNATSSLDTSTVIFTATSTTETIDSTGAVASSFYNVTFGQTSGNATWNLSSALDVNGSLTLTYGTLNQNGFNAISIAGNLTINTNGAFTKGTATTTFDGTGSNSWTDNTVAKQDMGIVAIDGTSKTITLGAAAKATDLTIGANDIFDVNNNFALEITGNFTNNNSFLARSGTVTFSATDTGNTITPGSSSFYNMTFNGSGGNWAFTGSTVTVGNNLTISNGILTLPTATTTVTGNFEVTSGSFMHNNGVVLFNTSGSKTITPSTSSFYDLAFNGSGSWTWGQSNATSSRNTIITLGSLTMPSGTFAIGGSFARNGGSFAHNSGTLKFTAASSQTIRLNGTDTYNLTFDGTGGSWSFIDTNATTTNTVRIDTGALTLPSGVFAVGGSWAVSNGSFSHNSGTVRFNSSDTGETIAPASSSFRNLLFQGTGGWTVSSHATSTGNMTLAQASSFALSSGQRLEVQGTFSNLVGGASTTWSGSTLYLNSGTGYTLNTKALGGDVYGDLALGANTDIKMWNSSSTVATVDPTGSLYSQDHAAVDGQLFIWGQYINTGNEYWSYATDFDGTALSGTERQARVRIASGASVVFGSGTFGIAGAAHATTTVANQGSGTYSLTVTGGTLNAQYYSFQNLDGSGLVLTASPTVSSLSDGSYELGVNAGSAITLGGTVIDANTQLEIQRVSFSTSTGITGTNVTATGTPSSYWWFRNHYGSIDGEDFDSDPTGNPGNVRWDDSGFSIIIAGNVYANNRTSAIGNPPCDGSTAVVTVVVNGGGTYSGPCSASDGSFSISGVSFSGDAVLTTYLNTNGGARAVTVSKTPTANIPNMHLYENTVIVRHEGVTPLTIANMAVYDSDNDSDIPFTAVDAGTDTLSTRADTELFVWNGKTFAPGGDVTLHAGGSGSPYDGRLTVATSSVFTAAGTESHTIGGGLSVESAGSITAANSTFTFNATSTGKTILSVVPVSFYNVTFNGAGGGWSFISPATTTVQNTFLMSAGTLTGTSSVTIQSGDLTGNGSIAMTGGTFTLETGGNIGGTSPWTFKHLSLGSGSSATTTNTSSATTTITGVLRVNSGQVLEAGSQPWVLSGVGTPFVVNGTFTVQTAPFYFTATSSAVTVADETYGLLVLAPSESGSPTYALQGGTLSADDLIIGGASPVTVTANTNDPSIAVSDDVLINSGSTFVASNVGAFTVGGSWTNLGTFTHSNGSLTFNSTDTGESITPGTSSFYDVTLNDAGGGWTIVGNATSSRNFSLTNATSFSLSSGSTLEVGGSFSNAVGGTATEWSGTTLLLNSGTSFAINTKTASGDTYETLQVGANTDVNMWNSSAVTTSVNATGSLYSQDHAGVNGDLSIWGQYVRSSGSEYWSYATDFDGTSLSGGSERQVDVRIASSSSLTFSGGVFDIIGTSTATTTIAVQGSGAYSFSVSGGTFNAQYYSVRNTDANGLSISGSPTVTSLSSGDFELAISGGTTMTVAGSVIDANPLKIFTRNSFATSTGVVSGYNVGATGSTASSWKFNLHYGNYGGEAYNSDPGGDPGYIRWDDSASDITISGNVYSDEGSTVSTLCNGSTQVVRLLVEGANPQTASCAAGTGYYQVSGIFYNPGDTITVFLDGTGVRRAANVTIDPVTNIGDMHLYEGRVIVRHEDTSPITIADMAIYDSSDDDDIPFTAVDAGSDTLSIPAEHKLIVWNSKTFAPAGDVTIDSVGSGNPWDGSLELRTGATFTAASTQSHTLGGSLVVGTSATLTSANSTFTFTATTTGKTITLNGSSLYNTVFNGLNGNWAFSGSATSSNDFTISQGTVTLSSATTTVGGSFQNTGGTFMHNNGALVLTATASGKSVRANGSDFRNIAFNGSGGAWSFVDTNATSSNNFNITQGTVTLPLGTLAVGGSFENTGTFANNTGTIRFTSVTGGRAVRASGSSFYHLLFNGSGGEWTFADTNATTTGNFTIQNGSTTLPTGIFAIGASFVNGGTFNSNGGTVYLFATTTGRTVTPSTSHFYNLLFQGAGGGWTMTSHATTTNNFSLNAGTSFVLQENALLEIGGTFRNVVGGSATTWATTTVYLNSSSAYTLNTKTAGGDTYGTLKIGANADLRMWNSSAATTTVDATGSLYSQDHAQVDGDAYIWGDFAIPSGAEYWSYATDFDGTALGGSSRQVDVRIASSSSVTLSGGTLNMVGTAAATSSIAVQGTGHYAFAVTGGTVNASYYQFRNLDASGLAISGSPTISSLANGDFELDVLSGASMMTLSASAIEANASLTVSNVRFATSTGVTSGYNVTRTGSPISAWTFSQSTGNYDGEAFDNDGGDACGAIRWSDSSCLFVSQEGFRWRNDDGGEGVPADEWYNVSWTKRKRIAIENNAASSHTNISVKIVVDYDGDMQSDFDDLRFTDSTGTTSISYWVEESIASASSTVWVEVPSLPASDSAIIYMYYGNNGASSAADGSATFTFFDDFEDDNIAEYSGNTSLFDVDTAFNYTGTYGLDAGANVDSQTTGGIRQTGSLTAQGDTIRFFQYIDATQNDDDPCTLFAQQVTSGQNYAVCMGQYPLDMLALVENVTSNDGSGTELASTTVTWTTGWYEVEVDWLTDNSINVTVYDANGSVFASVSDSDASYTSGGVGFSFWSQHGGWDFYSVRDYIATDPSYVFGAEQEGGGATWRTDEGEALSGASEGENLRLRFSIQNTGAAIYNQLFRLQYASKGGALNCESVPYVNYSDVPTETGGCGAAPACMAASTQFTNQSPTAGLLSYPASYTFSPGQILEDPSNQTSSSTIANNAATEVEYNFQLTTNATQSAYCFRVTDGGIELDNYTDVAEVRLVFPPSITDFTLNNLASIVLTEGATTTIYASSTVTDLNGYNDIEFATSTIYRSGVGVMCTADENNCYQVASTSCALTECSGNSCVLRCGADIQHFAEPTDLGSVYAAQDWVSRIYVEDSSGLSDIETATAVELLTVFGIDVDTGNSLSFGSLEVGQNSGAINSTTTLSNTGNANIDILASGTDLIGGASTIDVQEQKFSTTTFAYGACAICQLLTGVATQVEVDLPKATSSTTPVTDDVYWGINIPDGTGAVLHEGTNTFIATSE